MRVLREQLMAEFSEYAERQTAIGPHDDWDSTKDAFAGVSGARGVLHSFRWTGDDRRDAEQLERELAAARIQFKMMWGDDMGVGGAPFNWLRFRVAQLAGLPQPSFED